MSVKIKGINNDLTGIATLTHDPLATFNILSNNKPTKINGGRK